MPIETECAQCGGKFRVADKFAGKRAKCAKCGGVVVIPSAEQPSAEQAVEPPQEPAPQPAPQPQTPAPATPAVDKPEWYMQTEDAEEYGPVTRKDLDSWIADDRIDSSCQILKEGWDQWRWAEEVFPSLGKSGATEESPLAGIGESTPPTGEINPFEAPAEPTAQFHPPGGPADGGAITPTITSALAETRPWVLFLSIVGFVVGGLMAIGSLVFAAMGLFEREPLAVLMAVVYMIMAALYLAAAYYLLLYSQKIRAFLRGRSTRDLEVALVAQKSFWKLVGIVTAIVLVVYLLMFLLLFLGGIAGMMVGQGM